MMFSFPKYLKVYWLYEMQSNNLQLPSTESIIEMLTDLSNTYNQGSKWLQQIPIIFITDGYSEESRTILDLITKKEKIHEVSKWVYKNIILNLLSDTQLTTQIKIRIASNMLRVNLKNVNLYRYCADSLIFNIKALSNAILDEQLPF